MTPYVVRIDDVALRELDEFATYAAAYSEAWAAAQFDRLTAIFSSDLAKHPLRYAFFRLTGPPYRGRLSTQDGGPDTGLFFGSIPPPTPSMSCGSGMGGATPKSSRAA